MTQAHMNELREAKVLLENPSVAARFADVLAGPVDKGMKMLPKGARGTILAAATKSLNVALKAAVLTLGEGEREASNGLHKLSAAVSGGVGGAFGLAALAVELPLSTTIMLRSISDIARSEGEELKSAEAQIACMEVFALGGSSGGDDATETGYFAVRAALASAVSEAATYVAGKTAVQESAPALVRLVGQVATRFSVQVSEKAAAQAVPVIGAAGGALINTLFMSHFQDAARGHFVVRRLERLYGGEVVRETYAALPAG